MKILLLSDVAGIGQAGEVTDVSDGYARNYLIPKGLAEPASAGAIRRIEEAHRVAERRLQREREEAVVLAERLNNLTVKFQVTVGDQDLIFGTITSRDIAEAIQEKTGIEVDRRKIEVGDPIRRPGLYSIPVRLMADLEPRVNVVVDREEGEEQEQGEPHYDGGAV
ncbi:MAG: 50S ribosomal protein L9 [Chloroflexia bacterium]|nr:50S ribosomal protein L9 [Chloroflexia bacterium]